MCSFDLYSSNRMELVFMMGHHEKIHGNQPNPAELRNFEFFINR